MGRHQPPRLRLARPCPEARKALDLSRETEKTREAYGQTSFGQSCLLARRLIEARVPYVQVNWSQYVEAMTPNCDFGWDTHIYNFELLADRHGPIFDRVFSALLDDMQERGLLEDTLVVCMGEFGRTPKINGHASRDHWPNCYFSIWAGADAEAGRVVGDSDRSARADHRADHAGDDGHDHAGIGRRQRTGPGRVPCPSGREGIDGSPLGSSGSPEMGG